MNATCFDYLVISDLLNPGLACGLGWRAVWLAWLTMTLHDTRLPAVSEINNLRQSRLYTPQSLSITASVELTGAAHHYLTRVLRMSAGDAITLFNGDGRDYSGAILKVQRQRVLIKLNDCHFPGNESALKITLVQAISRGERMDYSLQKATELGVFCIQPVTCVRAEFRLDEKRQAKRLAHWQGVVISACEQSGRAIVPDVKAPVSLGLSNANLSK